MPKQEKELIVVYCLEKGCRLTCWHGVNRWEVSMDRQDGMTSGKYQAIMGPYCPKHRVEHGGKAA